MAALNALRQFLLSNFVSDAAPLSAGERWRSTLAGLVGMLLLEAILTVLPISAGARQLMAPAGASAVILFSLPHSPLGQPWSVAGGLGLSAVVGLLCGQWLSPSWLAIAGAVAISIWLMASLRCLHPPGGAMAIVMASLPAYSSAPLAAVASNVAGLLVAALVVNNLLKGRSYPQCSSRQPAAGPAISLRRSGIEHQDLDYALGRLDTYLDISERDLVAVYNLATESAFRRHCVLTCGDLMTHEVIAIEFATELGEAWQLLRQNHIKALPVLDRARHVIGLLTLDDFLRHVPAERSPQQALAQNIYQFLQATPGSHSDKPEVAGQIMHQLFVTASIDDDLAKVAGLLSVHRHPVAIPVVDGQGKLAGILSQSDIAVALYHHLALDQAAGGTPAGKV